MKKFKVTIKERQKDGTVHTLVTQALCRDKNQVIDFYGLNEPNIVSYQIEEIK